MRASCTLLLCLIVVTGFQCSRDELPGPPDNVTLIKIGTFKLDPDNIDLLPYDSASYVNYRNSAGDEIRLVVKTRSPLSLMINMLSTM